VTAPLALSLGDPDGVGPEIAVKAWRALRETGPAFYVVGDIEALAEAPATRIGDPVEALAAFADTLPVYHRPGRDAAAVIDWICRGVDHCLKGRAGGLVTNPIAKAKLYAAGFRFPGHTEFLGELAPSAAPQEASGPIMMLAAADLRVALVTVHEPLARAPSLITLDLVARTARVVDGALRKDFKIARPRLAMAALNPHAGEHGNLGHEDDAVLRPAVEKLRTEGIDIVGPLPADSLFHPDARRRYDAIICQYHDQALIPIKMLDFWGGVNITLGLPIVRTSPDHGTGSDIAGKGIARPDSLIAAIQTAATLARNRAC
jgi:4-hydroxythreonine-4-phosphate dehydrogenase